VDNLTTPIGAGAGSGILGVFLSWLGFKTKIKDIDKRLDKLAEDVRYEDTCEEICGALKIRLDSIEKMNEEMRQDIKELLKR